MSSKPQSGHYHHAHLPETGSNTVVAKSSGAALGGPGVRRWCDANTWSNPVQNGQVPSNYQPVDIPPGVIVLLDCNTASLGIVTVHGTLIFDPTRSVAITADSIHVIGQGASLQIGSASQPYIHTATITLNGPIGPSGPLPRPSHTPRHYVFNNPSSPNSWPHPVPMPANTSTPIRIDQADDNNGQHRAIHVAAGGEFRAYGAVPSVLKTRLNDHALAGTTQLTVEHDVSSWPIGARIAISTTDFYEAAAPAGTQSRTEVHTIAAISNGGRTVTLSAPLVSHRFGKMQYLRDTPVPLSGELGPLTLQRNSSVPQGASSVTMTGISFTPGTYTPPSAAAEHPVTLDERAEVILLDRKIRIRAPDDALWSQNKFGVHTMVMNLDSTFAASGVMIENAGQHRAMGRYPFHWHMLSYAMGGANSGQFLGQVDSSRHFLENSVVYKSANRGTTIHGTSGVRLERNFFVDITNHAIFFEDGTETHNKIWHNTVMGVRSSQTDYILDHDLSWSGIWITHPYNEVVGNTVSDTSRGIWMGLSKIITGVSARINAENALRPGYRFNRWQNFYSQLNQPGNALDSPNSAPILRHERNVSHGNKEVGMMTQEPVVTHPVDSARGAISSELYNPACLSSFASGSAQSCPVRMAGNVIYKNNWFGYVNRVHWAEYIGWTFADQHIGATGQVFDQRSFLEKSVFIGESLNNRSMLPIPMWESVVPDNNERVGMSSYHFLISPREIAAFNYFASTPRFKFHHLVAGGFLHGWDLYTAPIEMSSARTPDWKGVNALMGYLNPPPGLDGQPTWLQVFQNWPPGSYYFRSRTHSLATLKDIQGYWGPAGNYLVVNDPFHTFGLPPSSFAQGAEAPKAVGSGRVSVNHPYIGFYDFQMGVGSGFSSNPYEGSILAERLLTSLDMPPIFSPSSSGGGHWNPVAAHWMQYHQNNPSASPAIWSELPGFRHFAAIVGGHFSINFKNIYAASGTSQPAQPGMLSFDNLRFKVANYRALSESSLARHVVVRLPWRHAAPPARIYIGRNSDLAAVPSPQPPHFRRVDFRAASLSEVASDAPGGNPAGTKFFLSSAPNQWGDYDLWLKIADGIAQNPVVAAQCSNPANQLSDTCLNDDLHVYLWRN